MLIISVAISPKLIANQVFAAVV